ncbi:hypothetical protein M8997_020610 [Phyllobacterium sp. 21LDTY02-6]|jgi:DNA-directed RNA polymerase subunit RPC12/RpoP|uniref:hypothetical protein n=1 Tax=unclassified Phyllobacterium TaxID=2638441 RepID=UPI0020214D01|nr:MULTISPECIES: hypothetical protein [unclassified Phyllobacterium]MCO4319595.1 hypothetical protein [Phyllobacterium sp. 21LDTY02-6]MCX8280339.1 hypothetical protein [Phyllobacterium sp. 0TCS1.6C]MCX8295212.1 hypothetical protein [Phyllobacterium sp. 0TCS1.6A]
MKHLNHKLNCPRCGTIYLDIPDSVTDETPIHCSECGGLIGRWSELERDFNRQGGQNGVFEMKDGQILRKV